MSARLFLVPAATTSALVRERRPVDDGVLVVAGRPHPRRYALDRDVLAALGARDDVRGATGRYGTARDLLLARAWLAAHRTRVVVVTHADMVNNPAWFGPLAEAVEGAGAVLALVCDDTGGERVADWVDSEGGTVGDDADLASLVPAVSARGGDESLAVPDATDAGFPALLPRRAFYSFRAVCRDVLTSTEFAAVDAVYRHAYDTFAALHGTGPDDVTRELSRLIGRCSVPAQVVPLVRGAQSAFFVRGLLLGVDLHPAEIAVRDRAHRPLTDAEVRALRAYREPWVGVAAVVRSMDLEYLNMANMRLRNVDEDGHYTSRGLKRQPPPGSSGVLFRAQRNVRLLEGARPDDRFLPQGPRDIAEAVRWTKADLNLPGIVTKRRSGDNDWQRKMRVTVRPLSLCPHAQRA